MITQDKREADIQNVNLKLRMHFEKSGYKSYLMQIVSSDYYDQTLEWRQQTLNAPSTAYLCKTILMENTAYDDTFKSAFYPKYVCLIIQYITKINPEKVLKWGKTFQNENCEQKAPKSKFHYRLVPEDISFQLTGYEYNSVTPYCMNQKIPLVISQGIRKLPGQFLWVGGGHVDIKLRLGLKELVEKYEDYVYFADLVYDE